MRTNLPAAIRSLRRHRGWRQADLAARASVSRQVVSRLERGAADGVTLAIVDRVVAAIGGTASLQVWWNGERLDRLIDAGHAALVTVVARQLREVGWQVRVEVSFNYFGDRGRIDILAFHAASRRLLVAEVKTAFGDLQETFGRLDIKVRLAREIAAGLGWQADGAVPFVVVSNTRDAHRVIEEHAPLFASFDLRGRQAWAWLRNPSVGAPAGLLWFVRGANSRQVSVMRDARVRPTRKGPQNRPNAHHT